MALSSTEEAQTRALIAQQAAILSLAASEATIISKLAATKVSLADLAAASTLADADLFLIRQGTTEKSVSKSVLTTGFTSPDASTTVKGIVELATSAETITGTDAVRSVTPAGLQAKVASETVIGLVELATSAEVITGTDTTRVVTPAGLQAKVATETVKGIVELSNSAEAVAGTDDTTVLTPLKLRNALNASNGAPIFACRAWVNFNGTGTVAIRASGNVSSITDNGVGDYTVNFTTSMPDSNYSASAGICTNIGGGAVFGYTTGNTYSATAMRFFTAQNDNGAANDPAVVNVQFFR